MSERKINAIATEYAGCAFRSRLEARYACLFDLLSISWEYESLDLQGYIPDFLIDASMFARPAAVRGPVLVEVRPVVHDDEYAPVIAKIARSGWTGPALIAGATLFVKASPWGKETPLGRGHAAVQREHANMPDKWYPVGWYANARQFGMGGDDLTEAWRLAGQRTQWMPDRG